MVNGEIESKLEQMEMDAEKTENKKIELESRESNLKNAISKLEDDIQVYESVEKIEVEIVEEKKNVDNEFNSLRKRIKDLKGELSDMYYDTVDDMNVLKELSSLGEDVSDSMGVLEERMGFISETQNHLYELSECYGFNDVLDFDEFEEEFEMIENFEEPLVNKKHLPSENTGRFLGEKGDSLFIPKDKEVLNLLHSYGVEGIEYKNEEPDFTPFTSYETSWGEINGVVEIAHMNENRENGKWEYGRRPKGTKHNPNYELGNFAQADYEMSKKIESMNPNSKISPTDIEKYRKDNNLVWHECSDGKTMMLVPEKIHEKFPHSGGVSEMKYRNKWGSIEIFRRKRRTNDK